MNTYFSFHIRKNIFILGYHFLIIAFFIFLFFNATVNFDLLFNYKLIINPTAYKSIFYYLYGHYGYIGIIIAHIISSIYIIIALLKNIPTSKRILLIHGLVPLYGSLYGYLFFTKKFINFGFFGEIIGYLFTIYTKSYNIILFYLLFLFLIIIILQTKNIIMIINTIHIILKKTKIISLIKYIYTYFISWLLFFIPFLKKYYQSKYYINIDELIHKSIYKDFYNISAYSTIHINSNKNNNTENDQNIIPYKFIRIEGNETKKYQLEADEDDRNLLIDSFSHFGITLNYVTSTIGPLLNTIIVTPGKEIKLSQINHLLPDIARIIGKPDIRFLYPIIEHPHSVAFEYSHNNSNILHFFQYAFDDYFLHNSPLTILLGLNSIGSPYYIDITKAPHILLAGTTGSGKSNILNLCITELIWKNSCQEVQLILIDPKKSEFFLFEAIPHLLIPIAQSIREIEEAIEFAIQIMEERYNLFNKNKCKNIYQYNEQNNKLSFIVIIIDEYADIVIQCKSIEVKIIRLLQMSRAAGIHIIIATQRPSAEIINSIIKSNLPMRIACKVTSSINSRIILDSEGAEKLLGNSDMLLFFNNKYDRVHGLFISVETIEKITDCFKNI
jgi:hypothetical protein